MISILVFAKFEPGNISKSLKSVINQINEEYEILLASPDIQTLHATREYLIGTQNINNFSYINTQGKSKKDSILLLLKKAKGDFLLVVNGGSIPQKHSVKFIFNKLKRDLQLDAVFGRTIPIQNRHSFFGYIGHILSQKENYIRQKQLVKDKLFFPMFEDFFVLKKNRATKNFDALNTLKGDISHDLFKLGYKIEYEPQATTKINYPNNLLEYIKYENNFRHLLKKFQLQGKLQRVSAKPLIYKHFNLFIFPLKNSQNPVEFFWSLCFYPMKTLAHFVNFIKTPKS
jgi:hypothetical protein